MALLLSMNIKYFNMYHVIICDVHSCFPTWWSDNYINIKTNWSNNSKLNINVNIEKAIKIIKTYLKIIIN